MDAFMLEDQIKVIERVAEDRPAEVLKKGLLEIMFNIFDFFDQTIQDRML